MLHDTKKIHNHQGNECNPRRVMACIFISPDIEQTCIVRRGNLGCSAYFFLRPLMGFIWNLWLDPKQSSLGLRTNTNRPL